MLTRLYHTCGNLLWKETKGYGINHAFTKFYDGREDVPQQRIRICPTCQRPLNVADLMPFLRNKINVVINA